MFRHPAWAVGSYSSGPPAAETVGTKSTGDFHQGDGPPCTLHLITSVTGVSINLETGNIDFGACTDQRCSHMACLLFMIGRELHQVQGRVCCGGVREWRHGQGSVRCGGGGEQRGVQLHRDYPGHSLGCPHCIRTVLNQVGELSSTRDIFIKPKMVSRLPGSTLIELRQRQARGGIL